MSQLGSEEIVAAFQGLAASQVGDVQDRFGVIDAAINPLDRDVHFVGQARTVLTAGGDNLMIHELIPLLEPGDVVMVDGQGATHRALLGELMTERMKRRGAVGIVVDGAVRDALGIVELGVPTYARAVTPAGPYRNGPGKIDVPVSIGGVVVFPGDWVIGDGDGVTVVREADVESVLEAAKKKRLAEEKQMAGIRSGEVI